MSSKIYKTAFVLMLISIGSKVLGFLREFLLAYKFGASYITDSYIAANTLTITFIGGLIGAFFTAYLPIYSGVMSEDKTLGKEYNNKLLTMTLLISIASIILYYIFNNSLVYIIAPGFDQNAFLLTKQLSNILIFAVILNAVRSVVAGFLQYNDKVEVVYSNIFILLNIFTIVSILLASPQNPQILGYGYLLGAGLAGIILFYQAYKLGFRYRPNLKLKDKHIFETLIILGPIFINIAMMDINTLVDRVIASLLGEGVVSSLAYANKVNEIMVVLFATTMGQAIFPFISKLIANNKTEEAMGVVKKGLIYATIFILPISVLTILFSEQVITLLFFRGAFTRHDMIITSQTLIAYSIGMIFFAYRQIIYRVMLSLKMSKYIMYNSIIVVAINIALDLLLYKRFEHIGLALATSTATSFMCILMLYEINKKVSSLKLKEMIGSLSKILASILVMVVVAKGSHIFIIDNLVIISGNMAFILSAAISGVSYLIMLRILKLEELNSALNVLMKKLKKKKK